MKQSSARLRLTALGVAVFARAIGESSAHAYGVLRMSQADVERMTGFVFLTLGLAAVPALALAPLVGALASSRRRSLVVVLATLFGLAVIAWTSVNDYRNGFRTSGAAWFAMFAALAFESAFFSACRFAIVPEAARRARAPVPTTIGIFALATVAGTAAGVCIAVDQFAAGIPGLPVPLGVGLIGYGVALLCVLAADFPAEKPLRVRDGLIKPFMRAAGAILSNGYSRHSLLALCGLFAVGLTVYQWMMPSAWQVKFLVFLAAGIAIGSVPTHPFRTLGVAPFAAIGLAAATLWAASRGDWGNPSLAIAFLIGLSTPSLLTIYTIHQPDATRGHGGALLHAGCSLVTAAFMVFLLRFVRDVGASRTLLRDGILVLCVLWMLASWLWFFRSAFEATLEVILWPMYRISARGPGVPLLPLKGPAILIANHAAWFDPFWLGKIVPHPATPMMTSRFYDLPVISCIMRRVFRGIRVPDTSVRREAPEIQEAIAALDRGAYVFLFPEGWLRRKEELELRRFGRGIWHILSARPTTPLFPCWIDGGWGSMVSHKNGPPLKHKKPDFWRKIRVAIGTPVQLSKSTLQNHMAARTELMNAVLEARLLLNLPPIERFKLDAPDDEGERRPDAS